MSGAYQQIETDVLRIAYLQYGEAAGWPCILSHGFPYDVLSYSKSAELLAEQGARVFVPWLRGYGPTRFRSDSTLRSGEQAALGMDLLQFMDALGLESATLAGYDWGGRASCVVAALWPQRVNALVSVGSYNIQNIARCMEPGPASLEAAYWYQYFFHNERGRQGLIRDRRQYARLLWQQWSPTWQFDDSEFEQSALSFDNEDFVDVVIHSYRHRYQLVAGDPAYEEVERRLAAQPPITVPALTIDGEVDAVGRSTVSHTRYFTGPREHQIWQSVGHNPPQESPERFANAVIKARQLDN